MKAGPYLFLLGLAHAASGIAVAQKQVGPHATVALGDRRGS